MISSFLILILLFVSYSLISFNFYLFYFAAEAAEPLGSARGALRAPRSTGWETVLNEHQNFLNVDMFLYALYKRISIRSNAYDIHNHTA